MWMNSAPALAVALGLSIPLWAQAPAAPPAGTAGQNIVQLVLTVHDRHGHPVTDLTGQRFQVREDGVAQTIRTFEREARSPMTLGFLLDAFPPPGGITQIEKDASARFFSEVVHPGTLGFASAIDREIRVLQAPTGSVADLEKAVRDFQPSPMRPQQIKSQDETLASNIRASYWSGTRLWDALYQLTKALRQMPARRVLVVMVAGGDTGSRVSSAVALRALQQANFVVYILQRGAEPNDFFERVGRSVAPNPLETVARGTGGRYLAFDSADPQSYADCMTEVAKDLNAQYLLEYQSPNPIRDGAFRHVEVTASGDALRVDARAGYYAGDPPLDATEPTFTAETVAPAPGTARLASLRLTTAIPQNLVQHKGCFTRFYTTLDSVEGLTFRWPREEPRNDFDNQDAAALLREVAKTYRSAETFRGVAKWQVAETHWNRNGTAQFTISSDRSGKLRLDVESEEGPNPGAAPSASKRWRIRFALGRDGQAEWVYLPREKLFSRGASPLRVDLGGAALRTLVERYGDLSSYPRDARLEREDSLALEGRQVLCTVVRANGPGLGMTREYWVDKNSRLILQETASHEALGISSRLPWTSLALNAPPDAGGFRFPPPPGTREVKVLGVPQAICEGEQTVTDARVSSFAPPTLDFVLKNAQWTGGKRTDPRGKVVVLVFWTTFCRESIDALSDLERVRRKFRGKDVVFLGVTADPEEIAGEYLAKRGYSLHSLLEQSPRLHWQFSVRIWPTVHFFDRGGNEKGYLEGRRPAQVLETAIEHLLAER